MCKKQTCRHLTKKKRQRLDEREETERERETNDRLIDESSIIVFLFPPIRHLPGTSQVLLDFHFKKHPRERKISLKTIFDFSLP